MFWKRKKKTDAPAEDGPAGEDRLEREASVEGSRSPEPAPALIDPEPDASMASEPAATLAPAPAPAPPEPERVPNPLAGAASSAMRSSAERNGRRRNPQQRLLEDPVRIFGEVSSLMARDPIYAARSISDLAWIIRPAIVSRQVLVARTRPADQERSESQSAPQNGGPIAFVAWANVSDEVDAALRQGKGALDALRPHSNAWRSGEHLWVVAISGPDSVRGQLMSHLKDRVLKSGAISQLSP